MFLLLFQSTQNEVVRFIQVIFYPGGKKKLSVLRWFPGDFNQTINKKKIIFKLIVSYAEFMVDFDSDVVFHVFKVVRYRRKK